MENTYHFRSRQWLLIFKLTKMDYNFEVDRKDFGKYVRFINTLPTSIYIGSPILDGDKFNISLNMEMVDYNKLIIFIHESN